MVIAPQSEGRVEFNWPAESLTQSGEYVIQTSFKLKEEKLWADAGYEIAFGQFVFEVEYLRNQLRFLMENLRVANGDVNIGVHGSDFTIMFCSKAGSLISLKYAGKEMIALHRHRYSGERLPIMTEDFLKGLLQVLWYAASLARKCVGIRCRRTIKIK